MHEVSRPCVLMLDCYCLANPCTCAPVCLWAYVLVCNGGKFNFARFCYPSSCFSCLTSSTCIMCFIATALSTEIHIDIWQTSLTRPMSGTTYFSQTSQLEGMRAFESRLGCSIPWPQPCCADCCLSAQEPACTGCQERQPSVKHYRISANFR
jgi:hypothetical protein